MLYRPFIAADLEFGSVNAAQEQPVGNYFLHYGQADLSQCFIRLGLDLEKRFRFIDWNGGISYTCMAIGDTRAETPIYAPMYGYGLNVPGARLGRSSLTLKTGLNWHLNTRRSSSFFIDYIADIYMDRAADPAQHSAALGFQVRF